MSDETADEALRSLAPSAGTKLAAAALAITGSVTALSGLQVILTLRFDDLRLDWAPRAVAAVGLVALLLAIPVYRQRLWACLTALALDAIMLVRCRSGSSSAWSTASTRACRSRRCRSRSRRSARSRSRSVRPSAPSVRDARSETRAKASASSTSARKFDPDSTLRADVVDCSTR